jgi:hypothetical protein
MQHVHALRACCEVNDPKGAFSLMNPDLARARANARHRLPIARLLAALDEVELVTGIPPRVFWETEDIGPAASHPDNGLQHVIMREFALVCKFSHILSDGRLE